VIIFPSTPASEQDASGANNEEVRVAAELNIRPDNPSTSPSDPSNFAQLDSQTQQGSFRGLAAAALIYAFVYLAAFVTDWGTEIAAAGKFALPNTLHGIASLIAVAYSLLVAYMCRAKKCQVCHFPIMATVFLVVSSLGIAIHVWGWEQHITTDTFYGVNWVGIWLVIFPSVVTLPPKRILSASLLAWATLPGVALLSVALHGVPAGFDGSPAIAIVRLAIPVLICVGIA
jgi:hypothetical protein